MECKFDKSLLQAFVDGSIEPLEMIFLSEHLKVCSSCMDELKRLYSIDQGLKSLFDEHIEYGDRLSSITELTIDNLFSQIEEKKKLKDIFNDTARMGSSIFENSSRFLGFIPGIPLIRRRMSIAYKAAGTSLAVLPRKKAK